MMVELFFSFSNSSNLTVIIQYCFVKILFCFSRYRFVRFLMLRFVSLRFQPDAATLAGANRGFAPSGSNDRDEYKNEEGAIAISMDCTNKGEEERGKSDIGTDGKNNVDNNSEELEEGRNEIAEEESDDNDDPNKRWKEFVDVVNVEAIPNLEAYLKVKSIRTEKSIQFANAIDACIQALRDTTNEILSDVVAPVCNQYTERFEDTEDDIIKTMVSNYSRRNKLLKLMDDADDAWSNKYTKLTANILGEVRNKT